jgi:anaerobic ribonucleoside-triphosphate reductase
MYQVVKRDGKVADFNLSKISVAITKAFEATHKEYNPDIIDLLALKVTADYQDKIRTAALRVEEIQDSVESVLSRAATPTWPRPTSSTASSTKRSATQAPPCWTTRKLVDNYLHINDWRVKENSTVTYSVGGLILSNSGAITANYWLSEIYDEEIANAHKSARHPHPRPLHAHRLLRRLEP